VPQLLRISLVILTGLLALGNPATAADKPGSVEVEIEEFPSGRAEGLAVGADGRIVLAGRTSGYPLPHAWVRAYRPDGQPDTLFGSDGQVGLGSDDRLIVDTLVQPDGRILVAQTAGYPDDHHLLRRLHAEGTADAAFASGGSLEPAAIGTLRDSQLTDMALQPNGRLVVVGTHVNNARSNIPSLSNVRVARYLSDGSLDTGFGWNGIAEVSGEFKEGQAAVAVQPGGELLITTRLNDSGRLVIARLSADGHVDPSFGEGGVTVVRFAGTSWAEGPDIPPSQVPSAVVLADGKIRVPVGAAFRGGSQHRMALVGLTASGQPDRDFGRLGLALGVRPRARYGEAGVTAVSDPSGGIIVAGDRLTADHVYERGGVLARFRPDGDLDRSFGDRGVLRWRWPYATNNQVVQSLAFLAPETLVAAEYRYDGKYGGWNRARVRTLHAGYDTEEPSISLVVRGCRSAAVRIADLSGLGLAVARVNRRMVRSTTRKRFRVRAPRGGLRLWVKATDLAGNTSTSAVLLPRC
jgi:uncharacterized delta-60 repeat protein